MTSVPSLHLVTPSTSSQSTVIEDGSAVKSFPSILLNGLPDSPDSTTVGNCVPAVIPPPAYFGNGRTLVLCFDGTGDQFDLHNSNIIELFTILMKNDRDQQMCYYQTGIGTYDPLKTASSAMARVSKILDLAIAWDLDAHVMDGYTFLMQNYKAKDRICMFGFSRGAYTARALAGMIHKVGLLPADNHQQVPFAYKMYADKTQLGWEQSTEFKKAFSVDVQIEFLGVWDTVSSVGIYPRTLPFTTSNTILRRFRHALSLDERRARFQPNVYNRPSIKERMLGVLPGDGTPNLGGPYEGSVVYEREPPGGKSVRENKTVTSPKKPQRTTTEYMEWVHSQRRDEPTDVEEVWFAGTHADVGGGSVENNTPFSLARISLRWMVRECFKANTGIMFLSSGLRKIGLDPATLYPSVLPRPPPLSPSITTTPISSPLTTCAHPCLSEEKHELRDAVSPMYDQLEMRPIWWVLEALPLLQRRQREDNSWEVMYKVNMGKGRVFPTEPVEEGGKDGSVEGAVGRGVVRVHRSVKMRMEEKAKGEGYKSNAPLQEAIDSGRVLWVD